MRIFTFLPFVPVHQARLLLIGTLFALALTLAQLGATASPSVGKVALGMPALDAARQQFSGSLLGAG